mmetsp:Transcript_60589/g.141117  ORF Transcript_60589/g.141117 Transcript_60589/m.141117 type:complete len:282 (+) Transcript_60589:888-1733(+)
MAHHALDEDGHLRRALLGEDVLETLACDWNLLGVEEAEFAEIDTLALVGINHCLCNGRTLLVGIGNVAHQAPSGELLTECAELLHGHVAEAQHAELELAASLPIGPLELKEGDAQEVVRVVGCQFHDGLKVSCLRDHGSVVLTDEEGLLELALVELQELIRNDIGRAWRVEALDEPVTVGSSQVILRRVAHARGLEHGGTEVVHLAERRFCAVFGANGADAEGEGGSELDELSLCVCLLLSIQHAVKGTDDGLAEQLRVLQARRLVIRLVDNDQVAERWVI